MTNTKEDQVPVPKKSSASDVRGTIFSSKNKKRACRVIQFFGTEIELRQPSLGDVVQMNEEGTQQAAIVQTLISYAYVPGTDEKVFEDIHVAELMSLPFDANFIRVSEAVKALTQLSVGEEKNA